MLPRYPLSILLLSIVVLSCSNSTISDEQIRYSELPFIEYGLTLEIEESESYIPGQINSLLLASDGSIIAYDRGSITLEQFSPEGEHLATVASEGGGPGELPQFFTLVDAGRDTIMTEAIGGRRDLFHPDENGVYQYTRNLAGEGNPQDQFRWNGIRSDTQVYATRLRVSNDVQELITNPQDYTETFMSVIDRDNSLVQDSVISLRTPNPHIAQSGDGIFVHYIPFKNTDRFKSFADGSYMIARPGEQTLAFYDTDHNETNRITLNVEPREVTRQDIDRTLDNTQPEMRRDIEPRIDDYMPAFLDAWATDTHIFLHTETTEDNGAEVAVLNRQGEFLGKFNLSEFDNIQTVSGNRVYSIHRNPDVGDSIRIYEISI